jgi:hypothetical protein
VMSWARSSRRLMRFATLISCDSEDNAIGGSRFVREVVVPWRMNCAES